MRKRLAHETLGFLRHASSAGASWEFQPGDRVLADGLPGVVASVDDTNPVGIESYQVTLDNGLGGGEYTAAQLSRPGSATAALVDSQAASDALSPVEATSQLTAAFYYPELGTILEDRPPNERIQRVAGLQRTAARWSDYDDDTIPDFSWPSDAPPTPERHKAQDIISNAQYLSGKADAKTKKALQSGQAEHHEDAAEAHYAASDAYLNVPRGDEMADHHAESGAWHRNRWAQILDGGHEASLQRTAAYDPVAEQNVQEPPDVCSFCGNPGPWTDEQDTGRGTRVRCATCGGTMRLNADEEAGITGIQWQPEFPNSPENAVSRAGDPRATINDFRIVSVLNAAATQEAGYAIFTSPELLESLTGQLQATAASLNGVADEDFVFHFTASWADVRKKATRIRQDGGVRILAANASQVVGEVQGDTAVYESALNYVPGTRKVADWACGCKWGAYAWGRSPAYKRFEGRQCSHVLALQYEAQARGMFGREVTPDRDRLEGQYQRSPVQVQYERPSDQFPEGRDLRRRTVPPGNMRRTFSSKTWADPHDDADFDEDLFDAAVPSPNALEIRHLREHGKYPDSYHERHAEGYRELKEKYGGKQAKLAYQYEDVPPSYDWARIFTALGTPPSEVLHAMKALGVPHRAARAAIEHATKSAASAAVATEDGQTHLTVAVENGLVHTASGVQLPADAVRLVLAKDKNKNGVPDEQEATADPMGGQAEPGTDIPRIDQRDQSDKKKDPRHLRHHTNDGRKHAPIWGYGVPWGGNYMWCDQCNGSGCGHCGGTGQVLIPQDGSPGPSEASTTNSPMDSEGPDAGGMIGSGGMGATGAVHDPGYDPTTHMRCDFCHQIHDQDDFRETEDGRYKCSGCALYGDGHGHLYDDSARGWEGTTGSLHEAADRGFSEHNHFLERLDRGPEEEPDLAGHRDEYAKDVTTHTGHNYTLLTGTHTFGGDTMVSAHRRLSNGKYQGVGYLSWFGGKPRHDGSNIDGGVVYKAHVAEQHRRRGVASAMLDFARERHPEMDIRHSTALTEDGKAWAQAYASLQHTADYTSGDFGNYNSQTPAQQITPHAYSPNPASTGWASSADPAGWERPVVNSSFMHWESMLHHGFVMTAAGDTSKPPTHAGIALQAGDTGRVLMIQRSHKDKKDPAAGTWEFPGGGREDGDLTSLHTGIREWEEEVGQPFPEGGHVSHVHRSGNYVLHKVVIPEESAVDFSNGRATTNPDDPDGDDHEQSAWWKIEHAKKNPALRKEVKSTPWDALQKAASVTSVTIVGGNDGCPTYNPAEQGFAATTAVRDDWYTDQQKKYWDAGYQHGMQGLHGLYDSGKEDQVMYDMPPSHLRAPYQEGHEEAIRNLKPEPEALSHRFMQPAQAGHCATCGYPSHEISDLTGQCPRCDALQNVGRSPNRPEPYGGDYQRNSGPQIARGEHEDFSLRGYRPEEHVMHSLSSYLTLDEVRARAAEEVARTGKSAEQLLREGPSLQHDLDLIFQGTLHDEPEPALPSTDGAADDADNESENASDLDSAPDNASQLAVPGLPVDRAAPWGYPESAADHPNPAVAQPGSADLNMEEPENDDQSALESVIAGFQQTAGYKALLADAGPEGGGGDAPTDADIAAAARAMLQKTSMKDFSFAEQQALIAEGGGKVRARNFADLKVEGTHYAMIGEDDEPVEEALLFL